MPETTVTDSGTGVEFRIRLENGEVQFYDGAVFVSSYYPETLLTVDGGLWLRFGEPRWALGPDAVQEVIEWLRGVTVKPA